MSPDITVRNAGHVATAASTMLNRANTLINVGFGEDLRDLQEEHINQQNSYIDQCNFNFVNEKTGILNKRGGSFLTDLYKNNEEFREEIIHFVRDKKELDLELILDGRCKTNTLNTLGNKYLVDCITSKDNTKDLIEILAKYLTSS